jgi:23S rRNA pseudouridine2457 synthase
MLSQFVCEREDRLLGEIVFNFPEGIHAIGRLDKESEGLLILTTNKKITALLFQSKTSHKRTYLVQARYAMKKESVDQLRSGVYIRIRGSGPPYKTPPCKVDIVDPPPDLFPLPFPRNDYYPTTWLKISLEEGRYRQIRKMMTAVHHRTERLIRISIEDLELGTLQPGCVRELDEERFFHLLHLDHAAHATLPGGK